MIAPLPNDQEAEKCLLSLCVQIPAFLDTFEDEDGLFYNPVYSQTLFPQMRHVHSTGVLNIMTLTGRMMDVGKLERVGGGGFISSLLDLAPFSSKSALDFYLDRLRNLRLRRNLILAANDIAGRAADECEDIENLVGEAENRILKVADTGVDPEGASTTLTEAVARVLDTWQGIQCGDGVSALKTGFFWLDELTNGGIRPGEFWVIAARPSVGKSAIALNAVRQMAIRDGNPVGVFSLEMSPEQLAARALSDLGEVNLSPLWRKAKTIEDQNHIAGILQYVAGAADEAKRGAPVLIDRRATLTPKAIHSVARRWVRREGVKCIFVDYLQRINSGSERAVRDERNQIAEASNGLVAMAKDLQVPVIALAQINREGGKRDEPQIYDLKGSGDIEQDADLVGMLWNRGEDDRLGRYVGLKVEKHRNGPTGKTTLRFRPELTRFDAYSVPEKELEDSGLGWKSGGKSSKGENPFQI